MRLIYLVVFFFIGCHLQPKVKQGLKVAQPPASWEECAKLDSSAVGWSVTAVLFGALGSAGGGMSTSFEDTTTRYAVGGVSAGLSAFGALGGFLASHYAKRYTDRCTNNTGGK